MWFKQTGTWDPNSERCTRSSQRLFNKIAGERHKTGFLVAAANVDINEKCTWNTKRTTLQRMLWRFDRQLLGCRVEETFMSSASQNMCKWTKSLEVTLLWTLRGKKNKQSPLASVGPAFNNLLPWSKPSGLLTAQARRLPDWWRQRRGRRLLWPTVHSAAINHVCHSAATLCAEPH